MNVHVVQCPNRDCFGGGFVQWSERPRVLMDSVAVAVQCAHCGWSGETRIDNSRRHGYVYLSHSDRHVSGLPVAAPQTGE